MKLFQNWTKGLGGASFKSIFNGRTDGQRMITKANKCENYPVGKEIKYLTHGHQSSSFIEKCNDNKFMSGTSYNAEAGLYLCKKQCVLLFCYQLLAFFEMFQKAENA